jgi:hypothetical protein
MQRLHLSLALLATLASGVFWACAIWRPVPFQYSDGDTATWIWLLRHGASLFGPPQPLPMWGTNYPPLFLWLVAALAPSDEAILRTGALVALAGFLLATALIGVAAGGAVRSRRAGLLAALLFAGTMVASYVAPACVGDAPALALSACGLTVAVRRPWGWPWIAALLFTAAVMCKHSVILIASGTCAWTLLTSPRQGAVLGLVLGVLVGLLLWPGGLYAPLVIWSMASYDPASLVYKLAIWVLPLGCGVVLALALLRRWRELPAETQQALGPWAATLLLALPWTLSLGRVGSGANYSLELAASSSVLATVAAHRGLGRRLYALHGLVMACATMGMVGHLVGVRMPKLGREMAFTQAQLAGAPGAVLAESTWYTTVLGRPPLVMPFLSTQLALRGLWDPAPLIGALHRGEVARLVLGWPIERAFSPEHQGRFLDAVLQAARERYTLIGRQDDVYIYGPAPSP